MRVIVIGAGIGGLTMAQGLRRIGIEVSVHDRDLEPAATGGYRLHLDDLACAALRRRLTPQHYQALLASSASLGTLRHFALADHRLRVLGRETGPLDAETLMIGRVPLRLLLCHGLGQAVRWRSEYVGHTVTDDGRVHARFADGHTEQGDLLVGADGVGSRVARALAGRPTSAPLGLGGIAGRTWLTPATASLVPRLLDRGAALAIEPGGIVAFLSRHDPTRPQVDPVTCTTVPAQTEAASLVWGLNGAEATFGSDVRRLAGAGLIDRATALLSRWDPAVRDLVAAGDPELAAWFRFHAADPDADLTPWSAGPVTALGDAVHAMPPTGGRAAATAIRDADRLVGELAAVAAGEQTMALAVHRFQRGMAAYAAEAIRVSLQPLTWQRRLSGPLAAGLARGVLPVLAGARHLLVDRSAAQRQTTAGVAR